MTKSIGNFFLYILLSISLCWIISLVVFLLTDCARASCSGGIVVFPSSAYISEILPFTISLTICGIAAGMCRLVFKSSKIGNFRLAGAGRALFVQNAFIFAAAIYMVMTGFVEESVKVFFVENKDMFSFSRFFLFANLLSLGPLAILLAINKFWIKSQDNRKGDF